jgi:condensin-2 complex subunit G2
MSMLEAVKSKRFDLIVEKLKVSQRLKDSDVKESFEVFTKAQSSAFWEFVKQQSLPCIDRTLVRCGEDITESSEEMEEDLTVLKSVMHAIVTYYGVSKFKPPALFDILEQTQGVLACTSPLPSIHALQFTVAKLCELWWLNNDEGAENLIAQLITYLLMSSLGIEGHDANIKRLYALRAGFLLFDLESESSAFLRDLIERCFVHPAFMKGSEGQRLLAFLLGANQGLLVNLVASVIRPQLATGVKTVATAYGKILYLAWKDAQASGSEEESDADKSELRHGRDRDEAGAVDGAVAAQALEDSIQSLLRDGVHAAEAKYFRGVRFLLQGFHDVPRAKLDAMLLRVYDPILWRSMRCANATVRAQAAVVFLDVFPLQHADGRAEENDKLLQKQFDLLAALLTDSDHQVRAHAALGVCHILREYWESLPLNTTHNILKFLIDTLSVDASCANVRHAVFVGLGELFQQPLTHTLLKQLLPLLRNSIHDKAEKVRVAFIKILCQVRTLLWVLFYSVRTVPAPLALSCSALLTRALTCVLFFHVYWSLQIKGIRGMHFYEIVPVDHLLERLVEDRHCAQASRALTELLLNSFYPQSEGTATAGAETEQLNRCLQFVEKNPAAAEVFYSNLRRFVSIGHVAKLVTLLFTFLVTAESRRMGASAASGEAADEGTDENAGGKRRRANKV